jgi:hypothetical protein
MPRFLTPTGEIDEAKVSIAIERKADELARWRAVPVADCIPEARAQYRNAAKTERSQWLLDRQYDLTVAAKAFVLGALAGMVTPRSHYEIHGIDAVGSYECAAHCQSEIARIDREDRMAPLDRCLAAVAERRDISRFLDAAE